MSEKRKRPLAEAVPNSALSPLQRSPKGKANATPGSSVLSETIADDKRNEEAVTLPKFVRINRPYWDIRKEKYDKDEEESDDDDEDESYGEQNTSDIYSVPENEFSDWVWFISEEGIAVYNHLEKEAANRDQDEHGLYIYSNFTAYGVNEVLDNWLKDFNKEVSRKKVAPYAVWAQLEGLSLFLQLEYVDMWFQGDDCHGFAVTISMIGKALLTGLAVLKKYYLSNPHLPENCGLRNISLILALFVEFVYTWDSIGGDHYEETAWVPKLGKLAEDHNIEIKGPYNFQKRTEELFEPNVETNESRSSNMDADSVDDDIKYADHYSVKIRKEDFKAYTKSHTPGGRKTIGGTHYDLTKMSKAEKVAIRSGGGGWF